MSEKLQLTTKYQQLLRDLKTTVEGLLNSQVANLWSIYGGLNRLHVDVEKIFKHGCKTTTDTSDSDYWHFIQGLEWLQPDTSNSTFAIDCECKAHIPQNIKHDKASIWLYRSLESHSLSQKLSWLLSDKTHLLACYQSQAFLSQQMYAEATLICLRAVERNQPSLISEIKPSLFLMNTSPREYYKIHRRCSSFPDSHLRSNRDNLRKQAGHSFDSSLTNAEEKHDTGQCTNPLAERKVISGKLRAWNSTPNLGNMGYKVRSRSNTIAQSQTTPSTPNHATLPKTMAASPGTVKPVIKATSLKSAPSAVKKQVKHVIIDNCNIIEHTPVSNYVASTSMWEDLKKPVKSPVRSLGSSAPEYSFLSSLSGISGEKDFKKQPKKTFIEDGGMSVLPMATGYFPRPMKGQTLTSFLMSSQLTRPNAELDRENAHFSISEAVISAMEQIKCRRKTKISDEQEDSDEEINNLKRRIRLRRKQKLEERQRKVWASSLLSDGRTDTTTTEASPTSISSSLGSSSTSISSDDEDIFAQIDEASNLSDNRGHSMSVASIYSEADLLKRPRGAPDGASDILSAEGVALSLISKFSEKQLPRASDLEWLVSEEDAPQALLPMPKSWPVSPDDGDNVSATPLRGTREWAPPRPQIIFTLHPVIQRKVLMAKQNYRCAGCGMRVAQQYASKFRYCCYLGRYFCTGCHTNQLAIIPASVIQKWNFKRFPVSSFSYRLLEQMYTDPLFRIFELNKNISKQSRNLQICRKYRQGLSYLKDFILTCRFAETIQDYLKSEQSYIFQDPDIYSLEDLVIIRSGELKSRLKHLVEMCCRHTSECQLCYARGFICEICNGNDVLFPWQMRLVQRCSKCGCCYHIKCWLTTEICLRCQRLSKRRESNCSTIKGVKV